MKHGSETTDLTFIAMGNENLPVGSQKEKRYNFSTPKDVVQDFSTHIINLDYPVQVGSTFFIISFQHYC